MVGTSQNNILRQKYLENGLDLLNPIEFKPWTSLTSLGSDSIPGKLRRRSQWNHHVRKLKFWAPPRRPFYIFWEFLGRFGTYSQLYIMFFGVCLDLIPKYIFWVLFVDRI